MFAVRDLRYFAFSIKAISLARASRNCVRTSISKFIFVRIMRRVLVPRENSSRIARLQSAMITMLSAPHCRVLRCQFRRRPECTRSDELRRDLRTSVFQGVYGLTFHLRSWEISSALAKARLAARSFLAVCLKMRSAFRGLRILRA